MSEVVEVKSQPSIFHLTDRDLAERFKISPVTLRNWRVLGKGPRFIKVGQTVRYPLHEIEEWERAHTKRSTVG